MCPEVQDRVEEGRDCVCSCAALAEVMHTRSRPLIVSFSFACGATCLQALLIAAVELKAGA